ncbi:hypothetical protein [Phyllobacterium leguminum]|uniref:hypothetical protein n=1 Tax=Phyllobacterium leguminum TaxID=314237 RepID=UPI0011B55D62|nr:hypothetical protein [Phyllobacterium leguminum]
MGRPTGMFAMVALSGACGVLTGTGGLRTIIWDAWLRGEGVTGRTGSCGRGVSALGAGLAFAMLSCLLAGATTSCRLALFFSVSLGLENRGIENWLEAQEKSGRLPPEAVHQPAAPSATMARSAAPDPDEPEPLAERLFLAMRTPTCRCGGSYQPFLRIWLPVTTQDDVPATLGKPSRKLKVDFSQEMHYFWFIDLFAC